MTYYAPASQIKIPYTGWNFTALWASHGSSSCLLSTRHGLELKGGFHTTQLPDGRQGLLFTGSPRISDLKGMEVRSTPTSPLQNVSSSKMLCQTEVLHLHRCPLDGVAPRMPCTCV